MSEEAVKILFRDLKPKELLIVRKEIKKILNENEKLNNKINECSDEILKELEKNHHLSYGVALSIRQKLIDYRELKDSDK